MKPGNVLIGRDGRVKVVDFGIARAVAEAQMTLPGTTLGSVHYFSPEQARGETATNASDIYALGIVLFEMLTGSRPWEGDSAAGVALARLSGPVPDPVLLRPSLPPDLAAITRKALAAQPVDRFASAASMADALETSQTAAGAARAAGTGPAGSGDRAAPAAGAGLAASAGVARSNPTMVAYPQDAYAGADEAPVRRGPDRAPRRTRAVNEDDEEGGTSPVVWLSGLAAILLLAGIGFVVYQLLSGPAEPAPAEQVAVPEFVGTLLADATQEADSAGLVLEVTEQPSDQPVGIIIDQDPPATTMVEVGSTVNVTVASGLEQVADARPAQQDRGTGGPGDRRPPAWCPGSRPRRSTRSWRSASS